MKSVSASSLVAGDSVAPDAVRTDPTAAFSNMQWFLHRARNTIYYTAFQSLPIDRDRVMKIARQLVELAPQLTTGYQGAHPGEPLTDNQLAAVTSLEEVDSLDDYPRAWLQSGVELYDTPGLPLFRFLAVTRRGGPDEQGRASMVMVIASHALLEGSDSALLARSQDSSHAHGRAAENRLAWHRRLAVGAEASLTAVGHLIAAHLTAPPPMQMAFDAQVFSRPEMRVLANRLGVTQRALMYGAVMYALHQGRVRRVRALYTILGGARRDTDDEFIRARGIHARFPLAGKSPAQFIVGVDHAMKRYEARPEGTHQYVLNTLYGIHRAASRRFPALYGPRFFRFPGLYDIVLTMTPPHRIVGSFMEGVIEPIYAGSFHEGISLITFVPARRQVTINYTVPPDLAARAASVPSLIARLAEA